MNNQKLNAYIQLYKENFEEVNNMELYKWQAIRHFQENWFLDADDFPAMLENSLSLAFNLLDSAIYFPKRMIVRFAEDNPELLRRYFRELFDEDEDINTRIITFKTRGSVLLQNYDADNHYQDHRAIMVYLTLRYPDRYFFYKFTMFKPFVEAIEYNYKPIMGRIDNIGQFQTLCEIIRHELTKDEELILLHQQRLSFDCYPDTTLNILTQDFIYAVVEHLPDIDHVEDIINQVIDIENVTSNQIIVDLPNFTFEPHTTNYLENGKENKRVGDLGELWVLEYERTKLRGLNLPRLAERVKHHAKDIGDGLGYDILSFDERGNEMLIEVKTTRGIANTPFYVTANELARSVVDSHQYFLYRVYNFNEVTKSGSIKIISGQMNTLCLHPVNYMAKMI